MGEMVGDRGWGFVIDGLCICMIGIDAAWKRVSVAEICCPDGGWGESKLSFTMNQSPGAVLMWSGVVRATVS
jgi:hypothetical protein